MNGPMNDPRLGHKAEHDGNKASLQLAILQLMDRYGDRYPLGETLLNQLNGLKDEPSSEAMAHLRKEALIIHNPAIDFDKILFIKANTKTQRFSKNWQTRASLNGENWIYSEKQLDDVIKRVAKSDPELKKIKRLSQQGPAGEYIKSSTQLK